MKGLNLILLVLVSSFLSSCNVDNSNVSDANDDSTRPVVNSQILATIDGESIEQSQLDSLLINMFGEYKATNMDVNSRQRALDSMLAGHALAQDALEQLPEKNINEIQEKTRRYRENLLINAYMQTKMTANTLSNEKIKIYYENNLARFGSEIIKKYQLLTTKNILKEEQRDKFLEIFSNDISEIKLSQLKRSLEKQHFDVQLQAGVLDKNLISQRLYLLIDSQVLGRKSELTFIDGKPYIVLITSEIKSQAKPLREVRDTIRKSMLLKQLKQTIKEQSTIVLENSNIVYYDR